MWRKFDLRQLRPRIVDQCSFLTHIFRFGKVVSGQDVVDAIERVGSESGKTRVSVTITDCGQLR
jgi:cyclophilin family peptidyl-prolyl cis-trans isomerase